MDNVAAPVLRPALLVPASQGTALHHLRFPTVKLGFSNCLLAIVCPLSFHFSTLNLIEFFFVSHSPRFCKIIRDKNGVVWDKKQKQN